MDNAAERKDYVEAGRLQVIVKHLESNRFRLQDLENRMFDYASKHDFIKASHFQEQFRVLMECAEDDKVSGPTSASAKPSKGGTPWGLSTATTGGAMPTMTTSYSYALPKFSQIVGHPGGDYYDGGYHEENGDY